MPSLPTFKYVHGYGTSGIATPAPVILDSVVATTDAFVVKYDTLGQPKWAARISTGSSTAENANSIFVHTDGSVYVVGVYSAAGTGAASAGIYNADGTPFASLPTSGGTDVFLVKYNSNGVGQWAVRLAGTLADVGRGVAVDSSGNVYITGDYTGTATIYNADGSAFPTTLPNAGGTDVFIVKYNSSGVVQWGARIGSSVGDAGNGIAVDSTGAAYIAGTGGSGATTTAYNADGSAFSFTLASFGATDAFLVKYNTDGTVAWTARIGATTTDAGVCVAVDSADDVYIGGQTGIAVTVNVYNANGGAAFSPGLTNTGDNDAFLAKYNSSGTVQWAAKIGGGNIQSVFSLVTDSSRNVYAAGTTQNIGSAYNANTTTIGASTIGSGGWIAKYNSSGTVQYMNQVSQTSGQVSIRGVDVDSSDNLYCVGFTPASYGAYRVYNSTIAGNNIAATVNQINTTADAYIVKYNSSGAVQWTRRLASSGADAGNGITVDSAGNSYTCGQFNGSRFAIYGQSASVFTTLANAGGQDTFAARYNTNGAVQWAARIVSTGNDLGWSTVLDSSGNLYVGGTYGGTLTLFNADGTAFGTTLAGGAAFVAKYSPSGFVIWATRFAGNDSQWPFGMAVDSNGDIYVCGEYRSTTTSFFNSNGTVGLTLNSTAFQNGDAYLIKYSSAGFAQWVVRGTSASGFETGFSVTVDSTGSIYFSGNYNQTMSIISSNGVTFGTTLPVTGGTDAFLIKLDSAGIVLWVTRVSAGGNDYGFSATTDSSGNLYFAGIYAGTPTLYNRDGTTFGTLTAVGQSDIFLVKYTSDGFITWATRMTNTSNIVGDNAFVCKTDSQGNIYVGISGGPPTLYNSDGTAFPVTGNALVKYNSAGFVQWVCSINTTGQTGVFSLALDSSDNIYAGVIAGAAGVGVQLTNSDGSTFATTAGAYSAIVKYDKNGFGKWVQNIGNLAQPSQFSRTAAIAATPAGDVFFTSQGASGTAIQFYNLDSTIYKYLNALAVQSAFVVKQNSAGTPQWAAQITINSPSVVTLQTGVDSSGNVYVAGNKSGTTTFYNADGTSAGTIGVDSFIAKYNSNGVFQWAVRLAQNAGSTMYGMYVDPSGNVYATGAHTGGSNMNFYDTSGTIAATYVIPTSGANYTYIVKYDSSGTYQWNAAQRATNITTGGITADASGNVYLVGRFTSTGALNFSLLPPGFVNSGASGNFDGFVMKYNSAGTYQWAAQLSSTNPFVYAVATDSSGNVHITGLHAATLTVLNASGTTFGTLANAGNNDVFIVKYNTSGVVQWTGRVASTSSDIGLGIAVDSSSNVLITGLFTTVVTAYSNGNIAFTPTMGSSANSIDMFIIKYNSTGTVQWMTRGGAANTGGRDQGNSVVTDSSGAVYVAGYTTPSGAAFSASSVSGSTLVTVASTVTAPVTGNTTETFIVKYDSAGVVQWLSKFGGQGSSAITSMVVDSANNIYTTGYFNTSALVPATS